MVDKSAPKYKLDAKGNIINPPPKADAPAPAAAGSSGIFGFGGAAPAGGGGSGGGFVFGGTEAPAATSGGGGGFVFGGGSAAPAAAGGGGGGGGFVFGGTPAPAGGGFAFGGANAAQAAAAGGGGGFVFGKSAEGSATAAGGGVEKRRADTAGDRRTEPKRRRTRDLRLTGDESGTVLVVGNGDCGQLGLGDEDDDVRDTLKPAPMPALDSKRICQIVCGGLHTAALGLDGRLFTWGCNGTLDAPSYGEEARQATPAHTTTPAQRPARNGHRNSSDRRAARTRLAPARATGSRRRVRRAHAAAGAGTGTGRGTDPLRRLQFVMPRRIPTPAAMR